MAEYDNIANDYVDAEDKRVVRMYVIDYSFSEAIGDVAGKSVLDLGCGGGFLTRHIKKKGSAKTVGVDLSQEMIKLAEDEEEKDHREIKYHVGKVGELGKIGEFDVVTAGFLLHYAQTKEELKSMCKDIFVNLKPGGKFVTINNNPLNPKATFKKYEILTEARDPVEEGDELIVSLYIDDEKICTFTNYFWKKETYEEALKEAGFKNVEWESMKISPKGIKKLGKEFWEDFLEKPYLTIIKTEK